MQDRMPFGEIIQNLEPLCRILAWLCVAAIAVVTVGPLSWRPESGVSPQIERFAAFALAGLLFSTAYSRHILIAAAIVIAAAIGSELLQLIEPSRHGRAFDAAVKIGGSVTGLTIGYIFSRLALPLMRVLAVKTEGSQFWLNSGSVDNFQAAAAIQGVKLSASACCFRQESVPDHLFESGWGEFDNFSKPECGAISVSAILNRPPELSF